MPQSRRRTFSLIVLGLTSCGGLPVLPGSDHRCDLRPQKQQCTDWRSLVGPATTQEALCKTLNTAGAGGAWKSGERCSSSDSVGGCQTDTKVGLQTNWFYAPRTASDVAAECADDGTTFVTP